MELNMGSKYEDFATVAEITRGEQDLAQRFANFHKEVQQNYKYVAGYLYSEADLEKLNKERRPKYVYNLMLTIVLQVVGNFLNNQSKVEAIPRTFGDLKLAQIMTDMLDFVHYTRNDLKGEVSKAYLDAVIGRIGWLVQDFSYKDDNEGMVTIERYNPFRILFDSSNFNGTLKNTKLVMDRGWYSPEEIQQIFAFEDADMFEEIEEKAKLYLGKNPDNNKIISHLERVFNAEVNYKGKDQGYDTVSSQINFGGLSQDYYDNSNGLFKVIESHERRLMRKMFLYDPMSNMKLDITKAVGLKGKTYSQEKLDAVYSQFPEGDVTQEMKEEIWQTSVCPAFNMKLYNGAYKVQNGNFKYTPITCFDFGGEILDTKSYVDQMADIVKAFVLNMNTIQTYLMKQAHGETWYEEDALGEFEDDFKSNEIGAYKKVKAGTLTSGAIQRKEPPMMPQGVSEFTGILQKLVKETTGVTDNSMGRQEGSNESGRLFESRVIQSDILQSFVQDNALKALKTVGQNTKDYIIKYFSKERMIKISNDESNEHWLEMYEDTVRRITQDQEGNIIQDERIEGNPLNLDYDIMISKAPFGEVQKQREFEEVVYINNMLMQMNPKYANPEFIIKASRLKNKEELIAYIRKVDQKDAELLQQQLQMQQAQTDNQQMQENLDAQGQIDNAQIPEPSPQELVQGLLQEGLGG